LKKPIMPVPKVRSATPDISSDLDHAPHHQHVIDGEDQHRCQTNQQHGHGQRPRSLLTQAERCSGKRRHAQCHESQEQVVSRPERRHAIEEKGNRDERRRAAQPLAWAEQPPIWVSSIIMVSSICHVGRIKTA
jgi:hypothetical protein